MMAGTLKILSLNIGMTENLVGLIAVIRDKNPDFIFLQEIRISTEQLLASVSMMGYMAEVNRNEGDSSKPGTAMVWKSCYQVQGLAVLVQCRCQVAFLDNYLLVNVYAHSGSDRKFERGNLFSKHVFQFLSIHASSYSLIFGGDFNSILSAIDVENGIGFQQKYCIQLADLVRSMNLTDSFRFLNPRSALSCLPQTFVYFQLYAPFS